MVKIRLFYACTITVNRTYHPIHQHHHHTPIQPPTPLHQPSCSWQPLLSTTLYLLCISRFLENYFMKKTQKKHKKNIKLKISQRHFHKYKNIEFISLKFLPGQHAECVWFSMLFHAFPFPLQEIISNRNRFRSIICFILMISFGVCVCICMCMYLYVYVLYIDRSFFLSFCFSFCCCCIIYLI